LSRSDTVAPRFPNFFQAVAIFLLYLQAHLGFSNCPILAGASKKPDSNLEREIEGTHWLNRDWFVGKQDGGGPVLSGLLVIWEWL
jgi:hypothetical protein